MTAELGIVTLALAFLLSVIGTLAALFGVLKGNQGWIKSARNAMILALPFITLTCLLLVGAQWFGDYSIDYVTSVSTNSQPDALKITALWGGQAGSLLFYGWMLTLFSTAAIVFSWKSQQRLIGWVIVFLAATVAFFLMLSLFYENPFERTWIAPNGDDSTIEIALFKPEGKVVAYPWLATSNTTGETYTDFAVSDTIAPDFGGAPFLQSIARYDGRGLNPLLRHPGMVIHPPMLYLGFTGFVVPFAFAMASLLVGQMEASWIRTVRRWTLIAWMFLAVGLVLGGRWAYDVLGWGGYWGWDPVENSAFLPWLTGTAFLHSVMIQEKRGMLKGWNMMMIILTYLLVVFGTVATRTGLLSSVHSFAQSPLAVPMGLFLGVTLVGSVWLYLWRGNQGYFDGDHEIEGMFSRESIFLLNNWVFLALTIVIFWGTWAEKITDLMVGMKLRETVINLGPEYYKTPTAILFGIIYVLMGIAPLVAWRRATAKRVGKALRIPTGFTGFVFIGLMAMGMSFGAALAFAIMAFAGSATILEIYKGAEARHRAHHENWGLATYKLMMRNRRRYGGYIIHIGVIIMGIGIIGSTVFQSVKNVSLNPGESVTLEGYTMTYNDVFVAVADDERQMVIADVTLSKGDKFIKELRPRRDFFISGTPMTIAGTHSTIEGDFYTLLTFFDGDRVSFRIYYNPLVNFVWWGGIFLILGSVIAAWPDQDEVAVKARQSRRSTVTVGAGAGD